MEKDFDKEKLISHLIDSSEKDFKTMSDLYKTKKQQLDSVHWASCH